MNYRVKEIFATLQGEGFHTGRAAVFCRFSGCNLWSGQERHRATAVCQFCDTEFTGGEKYDLEGLVSAVVGAWGPGRSERFVVLTGGEPLIQVDADLTHALHDEGFDVAVETNGTIRVPHGINWICVSPKAGALFVQTSGDELKLVWPQAIIDPAELLAENRFAHYWLSPMDGPNLAANTAECIAYVQAHPRWRLSVQTHKMIGIR